MTEPQQSIRLGCFTASAIWPLLKSGRNKDQVFGEQAITYINERIAEFITGERKLNVNTVSTEWGNVNEPDAALWLQQSIPFTYHGREKYIYLEYNQFSGGSPDGLSEDAVIEIKCPYNSANHVRTLIAAKGDSHNEWLKSEHFDYYGQLQFNMLCADKHKGIFASYDPRTIEAEHRMAILFIERDNELLEMLKVRLDMAIEMVKNELTKLGYFK